MRRPERDVVGEEIVVFRMGSVVAIGTAVLGMGAAATLVGYLAFGWAALLVGAPLLVGSVLVFAVVGVSEGPRRRLQEHRAARWDEQAALPGGLMSGFFEIPTQRGPVDTLPEPRRGTLPV